VAKIKKRILHWKASESPQVVGYKIYWSEGDKVDYESPAANLGNVTQVLLPDDIAGFSPSKGPVEFGITAVDQQGNESDMITFAAAHQFNVPQAPQDVCMEAIDEYHATAAVPKEESVSLAKPIQLFEKAGYGFKDHKAEADGGPLKSEAVEEEVESLKYYGQSDPE
jgi:hypothetical protein